MKGILSNIELHEVTHYRSRQKYHTVFHVGQEKILFRDGFSSGYRGSGPNNLVDVILLALKEPNDVDRNALQEVIFTERFYQSKISITIS